MKEEKDIRESVIVKWFACHIACENCGEDTLITPGIPGLNNCHNCGHFGQDVVEDLGGHHQVSVMTYIVTVKGDYYYSVSNQTHEVGVSVREIKFK